MQTLDSTIQINRIPVSRLKEVDFSNLEFGKYMADHMAVADFENGSWSAPTIVPYGDMLMSPATMALHYGQSIFEGMKAFRMKDGNINIFRIKRHHQRINRTLDRMCMPLIPEDMFIQTLHSVIELDQAWVPKGDGEALYIRPLVYANEARIKVKISDQYKLIVMNSPVGQYLSKPFRLKVEDFYVRTAEGGTGFAKCAGNYGGAYYPTRLANQQGYDQVLWTDYRDHKYIDEVGMMNVMFVINGVLVTPQLNTAILDGVTRDTILTLIKEMGVPVEERRISVAEVEEAFKKGTITEAFGTGTAAVVSAISTINIGGIDYTLAAPGPNSLQQKAKKRLNEIRLGHAEDVYGWNYIVKV
jgi:branched-chain amino acid aminotransferase